MTMEESLGGDVVECSVLHILSDVEVEWSEAMVFGCECGCESDSYVCCFVDCAESWEGEEGGRAAECDP